MKIFYKLIKLDLVLEECENMFSPDIFMSSNYFYLGSAVSLVYFFEIFGEFWGLRDICF